MSTFSLVGAVVPVAAAGSLFAGFMSVTNLGYTFSYASGAWLYDQRNVGGAAAGRAGRAVRHRRRGPGDKLSLHMLVLIGSLAYFASFLAVHLLPGREATLAADGDAARRGPERWLALPAGLRRATNWGALALGAALLACLTLRLKFDPVASVLTTFLGGLLDPQVVPGRAVTSSTRDTPEPVMIRRRHFWNGR